WTSGRVGSTEKYRCLDPPPLPVATIKLHPPISGTASTSLEKESMPPFLASTSTTSKPRTRTPYPVASWPAISMTSSCSSDHSGVCCQLEKRGCLKAALQSGLPHSQCPSLSAPYRPKILYPASMKLLCIIGFRLQCAISFDLNFVLSRDRRVLPPPRNVMRPDAKRIGQRLDATKKLNGVLCFHVYPQMFTLGVDIIHFRRYYFNRREIFNRPRRQQHE